MNNSTEAFGASPKLSELLSLYDESFVTRTYQVILGRDPDRSGLENYLSQVRAGANKAYIVAELALSPEGMRRSTSVEGLREVIAEFTNREPPLWARAFRRLAVASTASTERHLRIIDNRLYLVEQGLAQQSRQLAELIFLVKQNGTGGTQLQYSAGSGEVIHAPPLSHFSPRLARSYSRLKSAISKKRGL